jgi:AcrR family transcriptional regulator
VTPAAAAARRAVQTRNATEEAILDAARAALAEKGFEALTMDAIARKAFVSRTAKNFRH